MNDSRDDLSTADIATQQPADTAPVDRRDRNGIDSAGDASPPDVQRSADVAAPTADPAPTGHAQNASTTGPLLATEHSEAFRARWTDVQTDFVDSPRKSVEKADALVAELMQHLAKTFADERGQLERQWDRGDDIATDDLRTAFQRYRSFFERLLST